MKRSDSEWTRPRTGVRWSRFDTEALERIEDAVERCLAEVHRTEHPFLHVRQFLDELRADPSWLAEEVLEVQLRIVRGVMLLQQHPELAL